MAENQPQHIHRAFYQKLAFKLAFLAVLLMVVVLVVISAVFLIREYQEEDTGILENGQTFAQFTAEPLYDDYVQYYSQPSPEDFDRFKHHLSAILSNNEDVKQVTLISISGRVLFDSTEVTEGKYSGPARAITDKATLEAVQGTKLAVRHFDLEGARHAEVVVPIMELSGGHVLSMRYVISYESLSERMGEIYRRAAIVSLLLFLFAVGLALLFARRLGQPITRLTNVANQIRGGDLSARATINRKDEIGELGSALNDMAEKLKGYYENLETKVRERTRELEAAQQQLLGNVKQDEALLASIGDGVIATDQSGYIVWMNKVAEEMLKVTRETIVGKPYDSVWSLETEKGEALSEEAQPISLAIKTGTTVRNSDYYYVRKDEAGKPIVRFAVAVTIAPVMLNGQIIGIINVFRDVTHERQVDRMKTEFISLASHQLRTPLSAIRWFTEMLINGDAGELTPDQMEFAKNVSDSTQRMIDLVNSLLNISRIESGRIIVAPKPTDLNELVSGIVSDLKAKIEDRHQTLVVSVHKDLPKIDLDPHLIGQVYLNLLTNAIKYTPKGGEISVFISRKGDELVSQVTDNGYGIPKEDQGKMFQKFFRATNVSKIETDGTGLGLYLIKAIVESSGGKIWFQSEVGKGTSFWFSLPMSGMKPKEGEVTLDV